MLNRNVQLAVPCPKCQHKNQETIAHLESNPVLTCGGCGATISVNADNLARALSEAEQALKQFGRNISNPRR